MKRLPLYYFNIWHSENDIGVRGCAPEEKVTMVWQEIDRTLDTLQPAPSKMYNDSFYLPNDRPAMFHSEKVPEALDHYSVPDGWNRRILMKLAERGTILVPCESASICLEWYNLETSLAAKEEKESLSMEDKLLWVQTLHRRNLFIAQCIQETLLPTEAGVLFLGFAHNAQGIMVTCLRNQFGLNVIEMNPDCR